MADKRSYQSSEDLQTGPVKGASSAKDAKSNIEPKMENEQPGVRFTPKESRLPQN